MLLTLPLGIISFLRDAGQPVVLVQIVNVHGNVRRISPCYLTPHACGTWQFCLHNDEPCSFVTFLCVSVAMHVTARGVRVITMKRRIWFGSVRG